MIHNIKIANHDDTIDTRDITEYMKQLKKELDDNSSEEEWESGLLLVNDLYFEEFAEEQASETGALYDYEDTGERHHWPWYCIDWKRAAKELKMDYFDVRYDDQIYWAKAQ